METSSKEQIVKILEASKLMALRNTDMISDYLDKGYWLVDSDIYMENNKQMCKLVFEKTSK